MSIPSKPHSLTILNVSESEPVRRTIENLTALCSGGADLSPAAEANVEASVTPAVAAAAVAAAVTDKKSRRETGSTLIGSPYQSGRNRNGRSSIRSRRCRCILQTQRDFGALSRAELRPPLRAPV